MNIILSPHFDDAVLSLGGLLAQRGNESIVATFFAGTPDTPVTTRWDTLCGFADSTQAMGARAEEDRRSLASFGLNGEHVRTYDHLDAQYRIPDRPKKSVYEREPELEALITDEIVALAQEFGTNERVNVYSPGIEVRAHDHHAVKDAALAAMRRLPTGTADLFFYQDLPHALGIMDRVYPKTFWNFLSRTSEKDWDYSILEREITRGSLTVSRTIIPLSRADMGKKLAGIALYPSQIENLSKGLARQIERFSAGQANQLALHEPYCEVTYTLDL